MTFIYDETHVPATHYKALLAKPMAEIVEDSIAINLLNTYFKTLKTLYDQNKKWFMQAILCIDMKIKPSTIKSKEYQALELTYSKFLENDAKHTDLEYLALFKNIRDNGAQFLIESEGLD